MVKTTAQYIDIAIEELNKARKCETDRAIKTAARKGSLYMNEILKNARKIEYDIERLERTKETITGIRRMARLQLPEDKTE